MFEMDIFSKGARSDSSMRVSPRSAMVSLEPIQVPFRFAPSASVAGAAFFSPLAIVAYRTYLCNCAIFKNDDYPEGIDCL